MLTHSAYSVLPVRVACRLHWCVCMHANPWCIGAWWEVESVVGRRGPTVREVVGPWVVGVLSLPLGRTLQELGVSDALTFPNRSIIDRARFAFGCLRRAA